MKNRKCAGKTIALFVLVFLFCISSSGCNTKELEERSFPLAIGIDKAGNGCMVDFYFPKLKEVADENAKASETQFFRVTADSYYEAWKTYEADSENSLDYNHLKVLVFGMDFFEDERMLSEFLEFAMNQENFARNTLVFVASGRAGEVLALNEGLDLPVGTFLEEMMTNSDIYKEKKLITLGDLYNEYYNQSQVMLIPVLSDNGGIPAISEYYLLRNFKPIGTMAQSVSAIGMLLNNAWNQFSLTLENGEMISLDHPVCEFKITQDENLPLVTIKLKCEAKLLNRRFTTEKERMWLQGAVNKEMQEMILDTLEGIQKDSKTDLTGSYERLGGYNRELYQKYVDKKEIYDANVDYAVESEITLVDVLQ